MNYLIKYESCEQVSPDDWRMTWKEKLITEETTIKEIVNWFESKHNKKPSFFPEMRLTKID